MLFAFIWIMVIIGWIIWPVRVANHSNEVAITPKGNLDDVKRVPSPLPERSKVETAETISTLEVEDGDPHICDKPDGAYYAHHGPAVPQPAGSGGYSNPEFLFDTKHQDDKINWAKGFKGTVPVCFIVNERGNPIDIRLVQSPGGELEKHIVERINGWRYRPAMLSKNWVDDSPQPIRIQMASDFIFK
jgi:hypothetical protein